MVREPSSEALTFVFTDLESSTRLWEEFPRPSFGDRERLHRLAERHRQVLSELRRGGGCSKRDWAPFE